MKKLIIISVIFLLSAGIQNSIYGSNFAVDEQIKTEHTFNNEKPKTVKLKITGMTCAGCSNTISNALNNVEGVIEQSVEFPGDVAIIKYNASKTNPEEIIKVIENTGYKAEIIKNTK